MEFSAPSHVQGVEPQLGASHEHAHVGVMDLHGADGATGSLPSVCLHATSWARGPRRAILHSVQGGSRARSDPLAALLMDLGDGPEYLEGPIMEVSTLTHLTHHQATQQKPRDPDQCTPWTGWQPQCVATVIIRMMTQLLAGEMPDGHHDVVRVLQAVQMGRDIYSPDAELKDSDSSMAAAFRLHLPGDQEAAEEHWQEDQYMSEEPHAVDSLMSGLYCSTSATRAGLGETKASGCSSLTLDEALSNIVNMRHTAAAALAPELGLARAGRGRAQRGLRSPAGLGRSWGRSSWSGPGLFASQQAMAASHSLPATLGAGAADGCMIMHSSPMLFQQLPAFVFSQEEEEEERWGTASGSSLDPESDLARSRASCPEHYVPVIIDGLPTQPDHCWQLHRSSTCIALEEACSTGAYGACGSSPGSMHMRGMQQLSLNRSRSSWWLPDAGQSREAAVELPAPANVDMKEVHAGLAAAEEWQWDVFHFDTTTGGHALSVLGFYVFHQTGLISRFGLDAGRLTRFLRRIEEGYKPNPYHNSTHAADVLQSMHVLLHKGALLPQCVAPASITLLACYLAAIVHDYEHLGVTNDYLIVVGDPLAVMYNDTMPLENYHIAATFALLSKPEYNFLESLSEPDFTKVRKLVIDLVMATNMKSHAAFMGRFLAQFAVAPLCSLPGAESRSCDRPGHLLPLAPWPLDSCPANAPRPQEQRRCLDPTQDGQLILALQMAIKCSDLGHAASSWAVHQQWAQRLQDELFIQGDLERARQLPVSKMCDRLESSDTGVRQSQLGFFDAVVIPMLWAFCQVFPSSTQQLVNALDVRKRWAAEVHGPAVTAEQG